MLDCDSWYSGTSHNGSFVNGPKTLSGVRMEILVKLTNDVNITATRNYANYA